MHLLSLPVTTYWSTVAGQVGKMNKPMKKIITLMIVFTMLLHTEESQSQTLLPSSTEEISPIPDPLGFAGMYAGMVGDELIAAGGANFLDKMPWEGGNKAWHDDIFVYSLPHKSWEKLSLKLPKALAYGVAISYQDGLVVFGGSEQDNVPSKAVYYLHKKDKTWHIEHWEDMPIALVNMCAERIGEQVVFAAGSDKLNSMPTDQVLLFDLKNQVWSALPTLPAAKRINAVSAKINGQFYLFTGIELVPEADGKIKRNILQDAYRLTLSKTNDGITSGTWERLADLPQGMAAGPLSAAVIKKRNQIVLFGGLDHQTAQHADPVTHPGFLPDVLAYDIKTNSWSVLGNLDKKQIRLTLPAVQHADQYYLISGEVGPGVRTNSILSIQLNKLKSIK
ncbi:hypothetical protein GQF61_02460 [Sphingobacterium sp. DK4209]|uniref:Attractin/MKLN-like beta-propeller domain-containing protein n=2 Tax=Sphingobacterium zhuxiongii TaxID=2662364 RepID=A0A5Q0QCV6_9SPHI|nr:hypothetical protein [Sphingobacterium sp. DK4209]QGA27039.1 hypothetical protein GFH32_12215 [Sphingobacterium sp. dk4302]